MNLEREKLKKVLLLDDEPNLRLLYGDLITEWGYDVARAEDGVTGLELFMDYKPDAIITDNQMPNMGGQEFVDRVRQICSMTPILFHSGRDLPTVVNIPNLYIDRKQPSPQYMLRFLHETIGAGVSPNLADALEDNKTGVWQPDDMYRD